MLITGVKNTSNNYTKCNEKREGSKLSYLDSACVCSGFINTNLSRKI
jgi:hypothetical protein